jgi:hypothetical protein
LQVRVRVGMQMRASVVPAGSSLEDARSRSSLSICALRTKRPSLRLARRSGTSQGWIV